MEPMYFVKDFSGCDPDDLKAADISSKDSIRCYLKDMSHYDMISREDERRLGERVFRMRIARSVLDGTREYKASEEKDPAILIEMALNLLLAERQIADKRNIYSVANDFDSAYISGESHIDELLSELTKEEIARLGKLLGYERKSLPKHRASKFKEAPCYLEEIDDLLKSALLSDLGESQRKSCEKLSLLFKELLGEIIKQGKEASDRLVTGSLRLVVSIAKKLPKKGMALQDMIQEGNLGLLKAVEKYDYRKGFKFGTYATWWVRQSILRAFAEHGKTIRIPRHMFEAVNTYYKACDELVQKLGREPDVEELSARLNLSSEQVLEIQNIIQEPISIYEPVGEDKESTIGDFIEDVYTAENQLEENLNDKYIKEKIEIALSSLPDKEQNVLRMRFGFEDGIAHSLEDISHIYGVSRERIRQIVASGIKRLNRPNRLRYLRGLVN